MRLSFFVRILCAGFLCVMPFMQTHTASSIEPASHDAIALLEGFVVAGTTGGYRGTDDFLSFIANAGSDDGEKEWFEGKGLLAIISLVLVGGLALNLTPCVLPMIPVNLAIIGAGAHAGSRRRGLLLGAVYGAAMAVVYGILGLVVILTAGTFGTINGSPWFNLSMALIFVVLGLAMFDVLNIDFSRFSARLNLSGGGRGSYLVAFGMGATAALLAGACVAPVVIQVVLFASTLYGSGVVAALALPFVLGLGMALPWPFVGAGISALPKPGPWMVRVKQAFGVFILGFAAHFAYLAYTLAGDPPTLQQPVAHESPNKGWYSSLGEGIEVARREQKPVIVDIWATWCKNCVVMDRTTLKDPAVIAALSGYVKIKFQAEDPADPATMAVMEHFGAIGLPTYVILEPLG